jgi:hypothetical protein
LQENSTSISITVMAETVWHAEEEGTRGGERAESKLYWQVPESEPRN